MQAAGNHHPHHHQGTAIQRAQFSIESFHITGNHQNPSTLTHNDACFIFERLRNISTPHTIDHLGVSYVHFPHNDDNDNNAVMTVICNGILSCPFLTEVDFSYTNFGSDHLRRLLPAFYNNNTSITYLCFAYDNIQGHCGGGGDLLRDLLIGSIKLRDLNLNSNCQLGAAGARGLGQGLFRAPSGNIQCCLLQSLCISKCGIGNDGLANLLLMSSIGGDESMWKNTSLTRLYLAQNGISGDEGGRLVGALLQRFTSLQELLLSWNPLGPHGARALGLVLTSSSSLSSEDDLALNNLDVSYCMFGNEGVANLLPQGQANRSVFRLNLDGNQLDDNTGGECILAVARGFTNLNVLAVDGSRYFSLDQGRRLGLLLARKAMDTAAKALGGKPRHVQFQALMDAHAHEEGLGAVFEILRNYIFVEKC